MKKSKMENLITIAAALAQQRQQIKPERIAMTLGKLQRLSDTLRKRYSECLAGYEYANSEVYKFHTLHYETKVKDLCRDLNIVPLVSMFPLAPMTSTVSFHLGTQYYGFL